MGNKVRNLMAAYSMLAMTNMYKDFPKELSEEEKEELRKEYERIRKEKERQRNIKRGLKEFNINGQIVWAINKKNALKKVKK